MLIATNALEDRGILDDCDHWINLNANIVTKTEIANVSQTCVFQKVYKSEFCTTNYYTKFLGAQVNDRESNDLARPIKIRGNKFNHRRFSLRCKYI